MARELLDSAQWFSSSSEALKDEVAKLMRPVEADDGHCFIEEGHPINEFIIIEEGFLTRTKNLKSSDGNLFIEEVGPGTVTGFLHVAGYEDEKSFATLAADGKAKVWAVQGKEFQAMLASNPQHALEVIRILSKRMRGGVNTFRGALNRNLASLQEKRLNKSLSKSITSGHEFEKEKLKVLCYDTTSWVQENFEPQVKAFNESQGEFEIQMDFTQDRLGVKTAKYASGYQAVCLFVNDTADAEVMWVLSMCGVKMIAMRCAGFDRIDTKAAQTFGISVTRVPAYSPYAVAEHAVALLMTLNRKTHMASTRVKMADFTLDSGLLGVDIYGKTVGVMGTGKIGQILCNIIAGFGVKLLAHDVYESDDVKALGGTYVSQEVIFKTCDIIFLMMPLLPATKHTINEKVLPLLKKGVIIINTSRGALIETGALVSGLNSGIIGGCGLDVYENEAKYFFQDWSAKSIEDNTLVSLMGNNRVLMTAHQAFFTREAIDKIVSTTVDNLSNFLDGKRGSDLPNSVC
mmetsp:Transcript_573/g.1174  ORF Transcript_573/g.1174 Transcript_573/m.1174 type:complete len:517 (-) Transcript_573:173-1723(-)